MSLTTSAAYPNVNLLRVFEDRLKRIVEECYEVSFVLCNTEMDEFGPAKIFDIFNQIFPTAHCLNTGYWPFYSSVTGQCLCACGRFGIPCRHTKSEHHWIDMSPVLHQPGGPVFYPRTYGNVIPTNYHLIIKSVGENGYCYTINLVVSAQYKRSAGRPARRFPGTSKDAAQTANGDIHSQVYHVKIFSRYYVHPEYYASLFTVVYQPNPFYHEYYGTYFKELFLLRNRDPQLFNMQPQMYCLTSSQVHSSTFVLQQVNVPTFILPNQISAFQPSAINCRPKCNRKTRNKGCQTPWPHCCENNDENCSIMKDVASVWNSSEILSQSLRDLATTPSLGFVEDRLDDFIELQDSEEYDNQLPTAGYDKVIRPHTISHYPVSLPTNQIFEKPQALATNNLQGVKRRYNTNTAVPVTPKMVEEFTKSCREADSTVSENVDNCERKVPQFHRDQERPSTSGLSYSAVLKSLKASEDPKQRRSEWWDRNFPLLPPAAAGAPVKLRKEIDEELDMINEVIRNDLENDRRRRKIKEEEDAA